ncbi:LuxR family transcriptional regulator [Thioclava sp. BHET1]|nr:LuxR family transcriptional regulator [Thioclava sp. BHET1]
MTSLADLSDDLARLAPAGFYIGLRLGYSAPAEEINQLPASWIEFYARQGLLVHDPVMKWIYGYEGVIRCSEIDLPDPLKVAQSAMRNGLRFGAAISLRTETESGRRSFGLFYRRDREFRDAELAQLSDILHSLEGQSQAQRLTAAETEALRLLSDGLRQGEIAEVLAISLSAVKLRLASAKRKLGAQTPSQAATIASSRGLL